MIDPREYPLTSFRVFWLTVISTNGAGPIRTKQRGGKPGVPKVKKVKQTPKSAEDLDKELDAFISKYGFKRVDNSG